MSDVWSNPVGAIHESPLQKTCESPQHHRRSIRLKGHDYSQSGAYFITICTQNRECLFGEIVDAEMRLNEAGAIVRDEWIESAQINSEISLGEFVLMPNHFHGIVIFTNPVGAIHESPLHMTKMQRRSMGLSKFIGRFKMLSSKRINIIRQTPGIPVWQRNYYEHIIRNDDDLCRIREYIKNNPCKWETDENNPAVDKRGQSWVTSDK